MSVQASEDPERDFARVRRRGRRDRYYDEEADVDPSVAEGADYYERKRKTYDTAYDDDDYFDDGGYDSDLDDDDEFVQRENDLFRNKLIPNPLLDNIDPDGAADRFPELASDPRFWFDMVIFIFVLNFISSAPWEPFPSLPSL